MGNGNTTFKDKLKYYLFQYRVAKRIFKDGLFYETYNRSKLEMKKEPDRTEILNFLAGYIGAERYLEIGVRNPNDNFNKIDIKEKYSVDPGLEFRENPVDFKLTSDAFFNKLRSNSLSLKSDIRFDIIFIDGLHLADQAERDVLNCLDFITDEGFVVLHDCNPPTPHHAREDYKYRSSPARGFWNGTTWKTFYKFRHYPNLFSICIDTDWGVGILSKKQYVGLEVIEQRIENPYFEYIKFDRNRQEHLNLQKFEMWKEMMEK